MEYTRTDDDVLSMSPVRIRFGETDYDVRYKRINDAREWRKEFWKQLNQIMDTMGIQASPENLEPFMKSFGFVFLQFPEVITDIVFSYTGDAVEREKVLEEATEEQMARAFQQIVKVAVVPFVGELATISQISSMAASFPALAKSTR